MALAGGDRLQLKFNGRSVEGRLLNNGELVGESGRRANDEWSRAGLVTSLLRVGNALTGSGRERFEVSPAW